MKNTVTSPKKKVREKSKTRAWEKDRRDRLSDCFDKLRLVLPNYDASEKVSKIDVLIVATSAIKDLREKLQSVLGTSENDKGAENKLKLSADIIKKLEDRVKKLLVRNEELSNLLKNAGIRVPSAFGSVKKFKKIYKHSNKITPSQAKILQKELEKENQVKPPKPPKPKKTKRIIDSKNKKGASSKTPRCFKKQLTNFISPSNCLFVVSQPRMINNSCYIVSKTPRKINRTVISNSLLVKTPIVSSVVKPSILSTNPALSNLGTGTLVFANGAVMPVVPTPPPLPVLPTIFTSPVQSTKLPTFIVVSCNTKTIPTNKISVTTGTKSTEKSSGRNMDIGNPVVKTSLPVIKPKLCITRTTQINKVPIPALTSKYYGYSCLENLKTENADTKSNLSDFKSDSKKLSFNNRPNKRKNQEESQQEPKKRKSNVEETKNLENSASNADAKSCDLSMNKKQVEVSSSSTASSELISRVVKGDEIEKQQSTGTSLERNKSIKVSVCNFEKENPATVNERCKSPTSTVKCLESQTSNINLNTGTLDINSSTDTSKSTETTKCHNIKETLTTKTSEENDKKIKKDNIQIICDQTETGCGPGISVELSASNISSATTICNKDEFKRFDINISQSEPVAKNSNTNDLKTLELNLPPSELSNDIFASFQVPSGCQNPGSTSPTAAFLLAFPLVSSGIKVTEVIGDETSQSHAGTPNLLQIGTMEMSKPTQSYSESLTPNILNFENFSFFSNKDNCGGFYNNCGMVSTSCQTSTINVTSSSKPSSSLGKSITVPSHNIDSVNQNILSKLNTTENLTFLSSNRTENNNTKTSNQSCFKTDVTEKVIASIKSGNINSNLEPLRSVKDPEIQPYASNSYNFNRGSDIGNITSNLLDMNTNSFLSKMGSNGNFINKVKSHVPGQVPISKSSNICTTYPNYRDRTSFITNSVPLNKSYNSVYTSATNNDYFYNSSAPGGDNRHFSSSNCNNYSDYRKLDNYNNYNDSSQVYHKDKFSQNMQPNIKPSATQNKPINWMTSPSTTVSYKPDYFLPSFSKDHNFNTNLSTTTTFTMPSNTYFNSSSIYNPSDNLNNTADIRKTVDISLPTYNSYQRTESEENQFSWSPSKMPQFLDSTHSHTFVSSTLPTLVGDLALNTTPILEQKITKDKIKTNQRKVGNCENQNGPANFLSVSQLVEHNQEHTPGKVLSRRSSGNRSKTNTSKVKRVVNRSDANKEVPNYHKNDKVNQQKHYDISVATNLFSESKQQPRNNKNVPSSYSAEALIGNQLSTDSSSKRNNHNKSIVSNFLSDNIGSYFPSVDVPQDNSYIQTNQTFQTNSFPQNFTTFQNNTYTPNNFIPSACTFTSSYIPNNNLMHNSNNQEFLGENSNIFQNSNNAQTKDKNNYMKNYYRQPDKNDKNQAFNYKKAKKKSINESTLPSFDIPFLSMPGTINSPILPDDFHTTYLPPTTLYSCKNPLYSKPNSEIPSSTLIPPLPAISGSKTGIQNLEMSQAVNSGTSLTNFNLSTIFPEINKGPVQENFADSRNKDYHPVSKSFSMPSSLQVPFSSKSSIPFGTFGT